VLVSGEPGLGKSRITAALEERLHTGRSSGWPLLPWPFGKRHRHLRRDAGEIGDKLGVVDAQPQRQRIEAEGIYEPPPSTASPKTPWVGRLRVRALRILESARIAA
jgi:hypothetical protein